MQQGHIPLPVGTMIQTSHRDRYLVEGLLGQGGFGTIYLVRDQRVKHNLFALKALFTPGQRGRERLLFECEALMRLDHPALPRVYRVFEDATGHAAYVLMDYIEGSNLELLRQQQPGQRFSWQEVLAIMTPIATAVAFLHRQTPPVVHRDIKPANIIVSASGEDAVLVDFSIAKAYESEATTTAVRHCSPGYGAPEQYGLGTTPRTDIYGLGATMYTLLTGMPPADALYRMIQLGEDEPDPLVPLHQPHPMVPKEVAEALQRALSLSSSARFSTVEAFWQALGADAAPAGGSSSQQHPLLIPQDAVKRPVTLSLPKRRQTLPSRKVSGLVRLLLVLFISLAVGGSLWSFVRGTHRTRSAVPASSSSVKSPSSAPSVSPLYSPLTEHYQGTIASLEAKANMSMTLAHIQQHAETIRGDFTGLGVAGPFKGTVDLSDHLQFQVTVYAGTETLAFEGMIQLGGTLAGTYQVLNQNQQFTGESGVWSVAPSASG